MEALTEQLDSIRLSLHNAISPDYVEPELGDVDIDLILSLADFIVTYESLVALLANITDQQGMHRVIVQARNYSHFIEHRNDEVNDEMRSEVQAFMMTSHDLFDNLEVNSNIGTQGLPGDWKIKTEILEHAMDTQYTEREIGVVTEVKVPEECMYEALATYYRKHSKEVLEEAQELISSKMDEIDQAYDAANVEELGVVKAQPRGESRHVGTGIDENEDFDDDDDDDANTLKYVEDEVDDDETEDDLVHMDEDNTTGLKIDQVISVETQKGDEPMDIDPENYVAPPIHDVDILEKDMIVISSQAVQGVTPTEQQKDMQELDQAKGGATPAIPDTPVTPVIPDTPATPLKEKETDITPGQTPVEEPTPGPMPPQPGPKPKSSEVTPEPEPPILPEPKDTESDKDKDLKNPSQETPGDEDNQNSQGRLFPGKFLREPLKAKPLRKIPKQTARKSTGGKPASDSRDKGKGKSTKLKTKGTSKSKSKGTSKRSKPELDDNPDDTPVKRPNKKKARKLSSSSEDDESVDLDVLPEEVPTRSSKRLAGEEAEKVDLPTPGARVARVARVRTGTVFIG